jgi:5'-nucleotidase
MTAFTPFSDLSKLRILLSNDDGIDAHGLMVLERIARQLSSDVWIVAPTVERSGAGHSLTIHDPLRPVQISERRYSISGTPTDCVMVAINHIMKDSPPDLVLSGINHGGNLGEDVHYSGTVAAAMEGVLLGIPSVALSQVWSDGANIQWETAEQFAPDVIRRVCAVGWGKNVLINVNFPDRSPGQVKGITPATQGKHKLGDDLVLRHDPRGRPYLWIGSRRASDLSVDGTDLKAVEQGYVTVTPLNVDLTHAPTMTALGQVFPAS